MTNQCKTWYGATRCNFEARYDSRPPAPGRVRVWGMSGYEQAAIVEQMRTKTYVHDICTSCGKIVKREGRT